MRPFLARFARSAPVRSVPASAVAVGLAVAIAVTGCARPGQGESQAGSRPQVRTGSPAEAPGASPAQIRALDTVLSYMTRHYQKLSQFSPGPADIWDYGIGALWREGIDGAGTTVAVMEGWNDPDLTKDEHQYFHQLGMSDPDVTTIYPDGKLPASCPAGMVKLGSYGSCQGWQGELELDVASVHLIAPYAHILVVVAPPDSEATDDAASQVAPYEFMRAVEYVSTHHLANVISISDGTGESTYSYGDTEITAQDPGELIAAAAGIPIVNGTGDCGVVQNLAVASSQCGETTTFASTAAWDDSPWVTAVGGTTPNLSKTGARLGPDPIWHEGPFSPGAGYSAVFTKPGYQDAVDHKATREVPDLSMDASTGTSEAGPLLAGVLALATQLNHGHNIGPVNPALYGVLGPAGSRDGIVDVVSGNNDAEVWKGTSETLVRGYSAGSGYDVVSGWGTLYAPAFVPAMVSTAALSADRQASHQASVQLAALEHDSIKLTSTAAGYTMSATGFLPRHPVRLFLDGQLTATLTASTAGTVTTTIPDGRHAITLTSMLITESLTSPGT
jgi:subtilase family serine protease